jgi:hypothetical protein
MNVPLKSSCQECFKIGQERGKKCFEDLDRGEWGGQLHVHGARTFSSGKDRFEKK